MSNKSIKTPRKEQKMRPGIIKPEGFIEDPEERRRLVEELQGSMPELPTVEEFLRRRRQA